MCVGKISLPVYAKGPTRIGSSQRSTSQIVSELCHFSIKGNVCNFRVSLIVIGEVKPFIICIPNRIADTSVERRRECSFSTAVNIHYVQLPHLVGLHFILVSQKSNHFTVWSYHRMVIWPFLLGKCADLLRKHVYLVNFTIAEAIFPIFYPIRREINMLPVR